MLKLIVYVLIAIISFLASLVLVLMLTGNLNQAALDKLLKREPEMAQGVQAASADSLGPIAQRLKEKEEALLQRERTIKDREIQLDQRQKELETLRSELLEIQSQIEGALLDSEKERKVRLETVAITVGSMKADKAAERLAELPAEEVAEILALVKDKDRGKIVEAMDPKFATKVLRALQERPL